jgi:predicted dehydrogenase
MKTSLNRRQFIARTGLTAIGLCAAPWFSRVSGSPNEKVNVGFVGCANRAADNLNEMTIETNQFTVGALCDVDEQYLNRAKEKHSQAKGYRDFRKMLEQKDLDAVLVGTPDHIHAVATVAALRSGRHVYCEKPLTHTISECRVVEEMAKKYNRVTQLGTQIHAGKNYRRVVELIQTGAVGPVREVHVWVGASYGGMERPKTTPPVPASLDWDLWLGPVPYRPYHPDYAPFKWRNWWAFGGGTMSDFGCHFMDLPHWALELRHPLTVETVDGPPVHPESTPPWLIMHYEYPERKKANSADMLPPVKLIWYHGGKHPDSLDEEQVQYFRSGVLFVGEKGRLLADYTRNQLLPEKDFVGFKKPAPFIPNSVGHHKEWIEAIRNGGTTTCNFDYSGALTEAALLGNVAYRVGKKLDWDAKALKARNCPEADQYIQHQYRAGWSL